MHLEPAHDVSCPGSALHERQHEEDAHGEVLERVGEPIRYRVYGRSGSRVHGDDAANNAKLLVNLEGVADEDRTARFMSVVALIDTDGLVTYGEGACEGVIAHEGRGDHGFGYDPLFIPDEVGLPGGGKAPNAEQYEKARAELAARVAELEGK